MSVVFYLDIPRQPRHKDCMPVECDSSLYTFALQLIYLNYFVSMTPSGHLSGAMFCKKKGKNLSWIEHNT